MFPSILIVLIFLFFAILMSLKKIPAILAMPLMACAIAVVSGLAVKMPIYSQDGDSIFKFIFSTVLTAGSVKLSNAIMYTIFGAILSQIVKSTGIAERIIKVSAELAGDRKWLTALVLTLASIFVFTSLTGVGGFIMVASIVMPVMTAAGISPLLSSSLILFALSIGGVLNSANWGFYHDTFNLSIDTIRSFVVPYAILLTLVCLIFAVVSFMFEKKRFAWSMQLDEGQKRIPIFAFLTPLIPIVLVMNPWCPFEVIPAFVIASVYGILSVDARNFFKIWTASIIEGIKEIAPVIGLFIGIGMLLNSLTATPTTTVMTPMLQSILPKTPLTYLLFFFLLAPLALYRGPFNLFGLGSGLAGLMISGGFLPPVAVMAAFLSAGQIQGICDPTNTHNVWLAQFMKVSVNDLMKKTILWVWGYVLIALLYALIFRGVLCN